MRLEIRVLLSIIMGNKRLHAKIRKHMGSMKGYLNLLFALANHIIHSSIRFSMCHAQSFNSCPKVIFFAKLSLLYLSNYIN